MIRSIYLLFLLFLFWSRIAMAQTTGCNDHKASNFNRAALFNDGSCVYRDTVLHPISTVELPQTMHETSGLVLWNHQLWSHNDSGNDNRIFVLDTLTGKLIHSYSLKSAVNHDWEEISQDQDFLYVGDFGNNASGCRTDLNILRIAKASLLANDPKVDSIQFSYSNQLSLSPVSANKTDFDCEAFIVTNDSIYLFTKQWISSKTSLYALPKTPGKHQAHYHTTLDVKGLVTGAVYLESKKMIALCGYSKLLQPFVYLLFDYKGNDFFSGNRRKIAVALPFHQVEGIASLDGVKFYLSNESFKKAPYFSSAQQMHILMIDK
jgi:hypothetical protein